MNNYLLLGAGFSRNWGGWLASEVFDYLIGSENFRYSQFLRQKLFESQRTGGFESALAELQSGNQYKTELKQFEDAVIKMFNDMNKSLKITRWEYSEFVDFSISKFLSRFNAIFTLNQDLLLESHYVIGLDTSSNGVAPTTSKRWDGATFPCMQQRGSTHSNQFSEAIWEQQSLPCTNSNTNCQPIYKLHGSSNWKMGNDDLLILGGNKISSISIAPVLKSYLEEFKSKLSNSAKLMVIGYGFRDEHINNIIFDAIEHNDLRLFLIGPEGSDIAYNLNTSKGKLHVKDRFENALEKSLIGASRRNLREIFSRENPEYNKVMNFFD